MTMAPVDRALLLARTVRHLEPAQVAHRLRLRAQKAALGGVPGALARRLRRPVPPDPGWPRGFSPLSSRLAAASTASDAEAMAKGHFRFLEEERELGRPPDWVQARASQLWRYHLHYLEWAWSFAAHPDGEWASAQFRRLWRSWRENTVFGRWDPWSPYVASLRAWALCGVFDALVAGTEDEGDFLDDLALHAGFVRANLEHDVGGNHVVKNLKAVVGLGVFLDDEPLVATGLRQLERELPTQVLADGGHFELSPSYHCQVLCDLSDVSALVDAAGRKGPASLGPAIAAMRRWLGAMRMPDGDVPLFNDCVLVGADLVDLLGPLPGPALRLTVLQPSGYLVARPSPRLHLVADVGPPCPPTLPAHAHADCLSFELAVDGRRLVAGAGTSTYQPGRQRQYERSTAAHSTVTVDGADQTEVWSTFRAARRARATLERAVDDGSTIEVSASHDGYRRLPGRPEHRRTWRVDDTGIEILDEVTGAGAHRVEAFLHLLGDARRTDAGISTGDTVVAFSGFPVSVELRSAMLAQGFGRRRPGHVVAASAHGHLPVSVATRITLGTATGEAGS